MNPCVDAIADRFLVTGTAPAADTTCQGTGIPAPTAANRAAPAPAGPLDRARHYRNQLIDR